MNSKLNLISILSLVRKVDIIHFFLLKFGARSVRPCTC